MFPRGDALDASVPSGRLPGKAVTDRPVEGVVAGALPGDVTVPPGEGFPFPEEDETPAEDGEVAVRGEAVRDRGAAEDGVAADSPDAIG